MNTAFFNIPVFCEVLGWPKISSKFYVRYYETFWPTQYLGHTKKKKIVIYLKFKFNWTFCILPGNPTMKKLLYFFFSLALTTVLHITCLQLPTTMFSFLMVRSHCWWSVTHRAVASGITEDKWRIKGWAQETPGVSQGREGRSWLHPPLLKPLTLRGW